MITTSCHFFLMLFIVALKPIRSVNTQGEEVIAATEMCQSEYLEQPPDQLTCNPYSNEELKLECTVSVSPGGTLSGTLTVDWFYSPLMLDSLAVENETQQAISRLDNSQEHITIREQMRLLHSTLQVRSRLEVERLDDLNVGQYWCGIRIDSMEWMIPSDPVSLQLPSEYEGLNPCSTRVAQSKMERKCATWSFEAPPSSPPPPPSAPQTAPVPGVARTTDSNTVTEVTRNETTVDLERSTTSSPVSSSTEIQDDVDTGALAMEFYIAVGILAAFGTVIAALISVVIRLCIKYKKMLHGKQTADSTQAKLPTVIVQGSSTIASDYLVPLSLAEQQHIPQRGDNSMLENLTSHNNPDFRTQNTANYRQDFTAFWLKQQQQRLDALEHSYETMNHDYEDIFLESMNSNPPVLMKSNEAYTIPRTLNLSCHPTPIYY